MPDLWSLALRLVGTWDGPATGQPGRGHQVREYRPALRGRYILGKNRSWWEPTSGHPEGELHEDGSRIVFAADQVQNGPPGMRVRETLLFSGTDELESTFELAMPGEDLRLYTREELRRRT